MQDIWHAFITAKVNGFIAEETGHLRELVRVQHGTKPHQLDSLNESIELSKATLRVYYSFLLGDKAKCLGATDAIRELFQESLADVMEGETGCVAIVNRTSEELTSVDYQGAKTDESARQLAEAFKMIGDGKYCKVTMTVIK